ncbi:MAG TPA: helix-turn-helix transcriptional regulator [Candidatus Onthocola stercoravium]|nr:helix-turn-helix transcriptional regulator [Candidatus Onthocola stercoravium]
MYYSRIKEIREDKGYTQKDIAKILNTTQQQYSKYELGIQIIPLEKINTLANYYNTSIDYLVGRTDIRKPYPKSILK